MIGEGCIIGWIASFFSTNTVFLFGSMKIDQSSWIGPSNCIGSLIGSIIFEYLIFIVGFLQTLSLFIGSTAIIWCLALFGNNYYHNFAEHFCVGWMIGGLSAIIILFMFKIARKTYETDNE